MNSIFQTLDSLLERTTAEVEHMKTVLAQEAHCLKTGDHTALNETLRAKEALATRINTLIQEQYDFLRAHQLQPGKIGLEQLLEALPSEDPQAQALRSRWATLKELTYACNTLNETNGAYIGLMRQHIDRSLDILRGKPRENIAYGPDGLGRRPTSSRKLLSV